MKKNQHGSSCSTGLLERPGLVLLDERIVVLAEVRRPDRDNEGMSGAASRAAVTCSGKSLWQIMALAPLAWPR